MAALEAVALSMSRSSKKNRPKRAWLWRLLIYIVLRNLPAIVLAGSVIFIAMQANRLNLLTQTFEIYLVLFTFGLSLYLYSVTGFLLGAVSAVVAIILSSIMNSIAFSLVWRMDIYIMQAVNVGTILSGFLLSMTVFRRYKPITHFSLWAVPTHFLLLGLFQRDQFGMDFFPYTYNNPIQWVPTAILAASLGLLQLTGAKNGAHPVSTSQT